MIVLKAENRFDDRPKIIRLPLKANRLRRYKKSARISL